MVSEHNFVDKRAMNNIWLTPPEVLDPVRRYGPIGLDPCTEASNPSGAATFFTEDDNGLAMPWDVGVWQINNCRILTAGDVFGNSRTEQAEKIRNTKQIQNKKLECPKRIRPDLSLLSFSLFPRFPLCRFCHWRFRN